MSERVLEVGFEAIAFDQPAAAGGEGKGQRGSGSFRPATESRRDQLGVMDPADTDVCLGEVGSPGQVRRIRQARLLGESLDLGERGNRLLGVAESQCEEPKRCLAPVHHHHRADLVSERDPALDLSSRPRGLAAGCAKTSADDQAERKDPALSVLLGELGRAGVPRGRVPVPNSIRHVRRNPEQERQDPEGVGLPGHFDQPRELGPKLLRLTAAHPCVQSKHDELEWRAKGSRPAPVGVPASSSSSRALLASPASATAIPDIAWTWLRIIGEASLGRTTAARSAAVTPRAEVPASTRRQQGGICETSQPPFQDEPGGCAPPPP